MTPPSNRLSDFVAKPFAALFTSGGRPTEEKVARRPLSRALGTLLVLGTLSLTACLPQQTPEEKACQAIVGTDRAKIERCVEEVKKAQDEKIEKTVTDISIGVIGGVVLLFGSIIYIGISDGASRRRPEDDENPFLDSDGKGGRKPDDKPPVRKP